MNKLILAALTFLFSTVATAQTFNGTGGAIPDGGATATCFPMNVTGVGIIDATYGLATVCINITHTFDGDLDITLQTPGGTIIPLSMSNGSTGDNYTNTCFSMAAAVDITGATAPFTGSFLPEGNLGLANDGTSGTGTWSICIKDGFSGEVGTLNNWSLTFNNTPAPPPPVIPNCSGNPPAGDACSNATPVCNFEGYCGNTSASYAVDTWSELSTAFCGSIENNSFITFVASATTANFNVFVTNSQDGLGIQMFFYDGNCGSGPVNTYGCYSPMDPDVGAIPVSATGLTPGNTYYLMFDGYAGDVCDYSIVPLDGVNILAIDATANSICVGQSVTLTASGGNGTYTWTGPNLNTTTGAVVIATPTVTSTYTVSSVDPTGSCPFTQDIIIAITNIAPPPTVTTPVTYCQSATATPLTATGISMLWYTTLTGGTGSATAPTPSTSTIGSTTYYVTQTLICGTSIREPIVVNIVAPAPAPTVTTPVSYCQNAVATALTATGTGLLWYTTATGGTGSASAPVPSTATIGTTTYYVSQTVNGCEGPRAAIVVTVVATPLAPTVTSPISYCQGNTATQLTATGTNLLWYTIPVGGTALPAAPTPSTLTVGTFTWYVSQGTGTCRGPRAPVVVNVALSTPAPAVTNVTYCQGQAAVALTATGTSLLWYTAATGGTGSATAPTPSTATGGVTTYYVTQTLSCGESVRTPISVTVTAAPAAPTVTTPVTYCLNATATALTATGSGLLWYTTATGGTGSAIAPVPLTTVAGNTIYYVSQTVGCEGPRAAITVTVYNIPAAPIAAPVTYCQSATATPLTATGTSLLWFTTPTGGTGSATAPTPATTTPGVTTYYVSQTVNGCQGPRTPIAVTILPATPAPTVTTPVVYCQGTTATALTATGAGLLWYTAATGGTGSAAAPVPSTATTGNTTYYVSQTLAPCGESIRRALVVTVNPTPAAPTVNTPVVYCQNATATALTATGTSLLWYTTASGGTGVSAAPVPSTATVGNTTYWVSQTTGVCEGPRASITVTVNSIPAAPAATPAITYCQSTTAIPLTATGTSLLWFTTPTGGTGSATAPTPATTTPGVTTYYVSQTVNGCQGPRTAIAVTILPATPAPTVTTPVVYCQGTTATALTATGAGLLWYTAATGGTGSAVAPVPSTATTGNTTYYVSQTLAPCGESIRRALVVTVNPTPAAPTVNTPVIYCQNATATALTATGTNLLWYTTASGGTGVSAAPVPSTATVGNTSYWVSQTTGVCEGPRASITVTVNSIPAAPAATAAITYCQSATATALTATGTSLLWYTTPTGGTGSATAPTPSTTTPGVTTYYVSQTVNGCQGPRTPIAVTILPATPAPTVTTPVVYCQGTTATALTATGAGLLWYTAATGGTGSAVAPVPSTATTGNTTYYVSQTLAPCGESIRRALVVTVNPTPAAPTVNTPVIYCQNATATALTATGTSLLWYTTASGGTGVSAAPVPSTATVGNTSYWVSQTTGVCEGPRASITVTVNSIPAAPAAIPAITYCQSTTAIPLTATGTSLLWYTTPTGGTGSATAPTPSTTTPGVTTYYVSQTVNGCQGPRTAIAVTILPATPAPTVTTPVVYCQGTTATALTATGAGLLWYTAATGGTGSATAPTPSTATTGNTTYYVSQTLAACGESVRTPVVVTINVTPPAPTVGGPVTFCQDVITGPLEATGTNLLWYNSSAGGVGNPSSPTQYTANPGVTTYWVSQTIGVCEGPRASITVTINDYPDFGADQRDTVCVGDSVDLTVKYNTVGYTANWTFNGQPVANPAAVKESGAYQLEAISNLGCADTVFVYVKIQPPVPAFAGNDTIAVKGVPHQLMASGGVAFEWTPAKDLNLSNIQNPLVTLNNDQLFVVTVTDVAGCVGSDKVFVKVYEGPTYYVPNAFSPNADGLNDVFRVVPVGISNTEWFRVFNRYGELVFETNQWLKGWDGSYKGKKASPGTYVWLVKGVNRYGTIVEQKGTVMLVR